MKNLTLWENFIQGTYFIDETMLSLRCWCNIILNPKSWKQFMNILYFAGILLKKNKANAWLNFMWIFIINSAENELCILCLIMENYIILLYLHTLINKPDVLRAVGLDWSSCC